MFLNSRTSTVTNTVLNAIPLIMIWIAAAATATAATKAAATAGVTAAVTVAAAMEATTVYADGEGAFHGEWDGQYPWSHTHAMARRPRQIHHTAGENLAGGCKCRYLSYS